MPTARSGHTLTWFGGSNYVLYGGIDNTKKGNKILPVNDLYTMKVNNSKFKWIWINLNRWCYLVQRKVLWWLATSPKDIACCHCYSKEWSYFHFRRSYNTLSKIEWCLVFENIKFWMGKSWWRRSINSKKLRIKCRWTCSKSKYCHNSFRQ